MFDLYKTTILEEWLENQYQAFGILSLDDLTINKVSCAFDLTVIQLPGAKEEAIWDDEQTIIFLNSDKPYIEVREAFFHELCHPLRHAGDQLMLPRIFRELQETQANQFQLYAAMPFFMIKKITLPPHKSEAIGLLAQLFGVTTRLASRRLEQIERRIYEARTHHEFVQLLQSQRRKADPANWCPEAKAMFRLAIQRKIQKGQGVVIR
ncbi:ImmA/IrrE family metallo-endopeptidase [Brevibacillus borstelensis]|uniref:ImmA/IrrE family metallo-endopeptidase n=1 Tax=Brevibacillus borstelensis TaxID=45462 RepID=UPI000F09904F|nr:ImmA/IrrE family metallo-endopeptidase [Brevibacillus borstelensis]MED1881245.1 ImmA/IrrE family metallo-endopeptidase [Brevibacillus borstelensis]RNB66108.1 ImmA/IrrE family metallo-endopeptidase [Brevibacillus borstelensis]GED55435.1 phage-like element PBSX protein XkdA [Brevibacillus borstelensis]